MYDIRCKLYYDESKDKEEEEVVPEVFTRITMIERRK